MVLILSLRKGLVGMSKIIKPKGRRSIPDELMQFGRHLVYSEGTKTEPNYVESIKNEIATKYKCDINAIEIIIGNKDKSYNTKGLIKYALKDVRERKNRGEQINHVWFFFDKDDFPTASFNEACMKSNKLNDSKTENGEGFKYNQELNITFHSCYSNEAFELWLYLYFEYLEASLTRADYIKKIENKVQQKHKDYRFDKAQTGLHRFLIENGGSIDKAIKNAKRLCEKNKFENPSTAVYEFAEYFLPYMKKD